MSPDDDLLTTNEAAKILRCSRQHVVDLCEDGELPHIRVGTHRRLRRRDVLNYAQPHLRREEEQSLWLHLAVVGKLVVNPDRVMGIARENLAKHRQIHNSGRSGVWHDHWQRILDQGPDAVLDTLTSRSPLAIELRQTGPFAGVLDQDERARLLASFRAHWRQHAEAAA